MSNNIGVNLLISICWEEICITYGISITWVVTLGGAKSTVGIENE